MPTSNPSYLPGPIQRGHQTYNNFVEFIRACDASDIPFHEYTFEPASGDIGQDEDTTYDSGCSGFTLLHAGTGMHITVLVLNDGRVRVHKD